MRQIALGVRESGVETRILALSAHPREAQKNYANEPEVIWLQLDFQLAGCGFSFEALYRFRELASWADVIHYHFPWPYADVLHLIGRPNKPAVLTYHSDIVKQDRLMMIYRPLMRRFLGSVQAIVATSPAYVDSSPVLQEHIEKVRIIPIGIDPASYPAPSPERIAFWRAHVGEGFFLFIGVVRYYKGLRTLLDAVEHTDLPLVILGEGLDLPALRQLADDKGLKNVHFIGGQPDEDKMALLSLCIGLVLPSHLRSEAFGVSLLEAMMLGKPVISCEIGTGTSFVNLHGHTGLVVPPSDPSALRAAMIRFVESPGERVVWGAQAKLRFEQNFIARGMADAYYALYRELIRKPVIDLAPRGERRPGTQSVLVIGASSQIGRFVIPRLLASGRDIHAISRNPHPSVKDSGVVWHVCDILSGGLPTTDAETLIHLAPLPLLPPLLAKLPEGGLKRIIAFGSTSRFSKANSGDPEEQAFARALVEAEEAIAAYCEPRGIAWTVFRPTLIYGCGMDKNVAVITRFIRRFRFFPVIGDALGHRQPVHADDLAKACLDILDHPDAFNRAYDLSGGETLSYRAMVERIFAAAGIRPHFLRIPLPLFQAAMELASLLPKYRHYSGEMASRMAVDLCFDNTPAMQAFGYDPRPFEPPHS
ncbi:glycosyltransferase [Methylococcus sp. EFPC2]|uniref:glycosyltransferase n=1 Tax=Methylococcus sp. EFPC2 TaxID=2812648 RepID=UPI0019671962|nr:glycosyltransferase [Methylococcus sp. EFPC2]QSA96825.1 glycosyltransferase [Methylococcus sp. EFPC2]